MKIEFNSFLTLILVLFWILINSLNYSDIYFINDKVIILSNLLCLEIFLILLIAKKTKNIFLTYLAFFLLIFYVFRIITLLLFDPNPYLNQYDFNAEDYIKTLEVILVFLPFIALCTIIGNKLFYKKFIFSKKHNHNKYFNIVMFIAFTSFLPNILTSLDIGVISYFSSFLRPYYPQGTIVLLTIVYYLTHISYLNKKQKFKMYIFFVLVVLISLFSGNKSSVFGLALSFFTVFLVVKRTIFIKIKHVLYSFFLLIFALYTYFLGNIIRDIVWRGEEGLSSIVTIISSINIDYIFNLSSFFASHFFGRIGFLDYSVRIIKNLSTYDSLFTFNQYFQSFIDNLIPGSIFNSARISTALTYFDNYSAIPTQTELSTVGYNSNAITVFGEFYSLGSGTFFGSILLVFYLLIVIIVFSIFIKKSKSETQYNILLVLFLGFFNLTLNSFGIDWGLQSLVINLTFFMIFKKYYI